ncbi:AT-hook motif nuclear-localized protein 5, partial [Mucuna pruriens]
MNDTKESNKNNIEYSVALPNVVDVKQEENILPPFTSTTGGTISPVPATMAMNDMQFFMAFLQGSNLKSFPAKVVPVNSCEDILEKLIPYAVTNEIFILGATGEVSYLELLNPPEAPVANTVLQGNFEISSIEGNIVLTKNHDKNRISCVTVLVAGNDGQIRGGPVRSLIAKSAVQVIVSTISKDAIQNMASKKYCKVDEHPPFPDQATRMEDAVDRIYRATLKELNQTNTYVSPSS